MPKIKIPEHATRVFEGIYFDVYHWQQEMLDGTVRTFEAIKQRTSVTIIAVVGERIMLNWETQPGRDSFQTFPAGGVEPDEDPLSAAKRELFEETGYVSEAWHEWFTSEPIASTRIDWKNNFFIARNCLQVGSEASTAGEKIRVDFIDFEEFVSLYERAKFRNKDLGEILEKAAKNIDDKKSLYRTVFGREPNF